MSKFEVYIPAANASEFNVTLKVDADNWMGALRAGMKRVGESGQLAKNILCDFMDDNSIHVTDAGSGRVFRIKELTGDAAPASPPAQAPSPDAGFSDAPGPQEMPAVQAPFPLPAPVSRPEPEPFLDPTLIPRAAAKSPAVWRAPEPEPKPPPVAEPAPAPRPAPVARKEEPPRKASESEARQVEQVAAPAAPVTGPIGRSKQMLQMEEVLSELFERTQEIYNLGQDREAGMAFILDLAMEKIPAESGTVFLTDSEGFDLVVSAVRGPKAAELKKLNLRIPPGRGIVGFCSQEAVSLAISDVARDPRYHKEVSQRLGYETRSILCCPMVLQGRSFGAVQIINKKDNSHFTEGELAVLGYLAHQGARFLSTL